MSYGRALLLPLIGVTGGALWVMAQWLGPNSNDSILETLPAILAGYLVLGAISQRWLAPNATATLAISFLAGQVLASDEYDYRNSVEIDGMGEYFPIIFHVLFIAFVAMGCALVGHWLASLVRRRVAVKA